MGEVPEAIPVSEMRALWEWLGLGAVCTAADFLFWMGLIDRETRLFYAERAEQREREADKEKD